MAQAQEMRVTAFAYAKPGWLVTYRHADTGLVFQRELVGFGFIKIPTPGLLRNRGRHELLSVVRVAGDYDPAVHDLATILATYRTHP